MTEDVSRINHNLIGFPDGATPIVFAKITDKPGAFEWANRCVDAVSAVERIEALHVRIEWDHGIFVCEHCRSIEYDALDDIDTYSTRVEWPCPTITALTGR